MNTSSLTALSQTFAQHFATLSKKSPLYAIREQNWETFQRQGLPSPKVEKYKYTPITQRLTQTFDSDTQIGPTSQLPVTATDTLPYANIDAYHIVLLNGRLNKISDDLANQGASIKVTSFEEAYQQQQSIFLQYLAQQTHSPTDAFAALNTALFEQGIFIHISDHTVLQKPVLIYHITDAQPKPLLTCPKILVVSGKNSQASLINIGVSLGQHPSLINVMTEIIVGESAHLDYYTLQTQLSPQAYCVTNTQCQQAAQSNFSAYTFTWSSNLVRNNLNIVSNAPHTETNMYGLYYLQAQQHVDNYTQIHHRQPNTYSNELYKGIVADQSTGVFNGSIYVQRQAQKTNAFQTNNNLVLSDQATVHTKPQLEIWADDVKCSHGATVGQLDAAQLFYLQSRGIPKNTARQLLLQAFAGEITTKVPLAPLKSLLQEQLALHLNQMD